MGEELAIADVSARPEFERRLGLVFGWPPQRRAGVVTVAAVLGHDELLELVDAVALVQPVADVTFRRQPGQFDEANASADSPQLLGNVTRMLPAWIVVVDEDR